MSLTRSAGRALLWLCLLALLAGFATPLAANRATYKNFSQPIATETANETALDLNRAGYAELLNLPGIGPALAQRILSRRMLRGPILSWEELDEIRGIGPATIEKLRSSPGVCLGESCTAR